MAKPGDVKVDVFFAPPKFQLFEEVRFLYCFVGKNRKRCYKEGIVVGVEFFPPNTEVLGYWYKVIIFSKLESRKKESIDITDLGNIIEIEVHELDIKKLNKKTSEEDLLKFKCALLELRMDIISNYKIGNKYQIRLKDSPS